MAEAPGLFTPRDARDRREWARLLAFCARHGRAAFSRDPLIGGHVTGSAVLLSPDGGEMLLTHHSKLDRWLQPSGHCDGEADVAQVALREAREESGLAGITLLSPEVFDIDIHEIPANAREPAHLHYDLRYLMRAGSRGFAVSHESRALAWVPLAEVGRYTRAPSVLRLRDRVLADRGAEAAHRIGRDTG